jgi:hypothetical protein
VARFANYSPITLQGDATLCKLIAELNDSNMLRQACLLAQDVKWSA